MVEHPVEGGLPDRQHPPQITRRQRLSRHEEERLHGSRYLLYVLALVPCVLFLPICELQLFPLDSCHSSNYTVLPSSFATLDVSEQGPGGACQASFSSVIITWFHRASGVTAAALALGASVRKDVRVRVPSRARLGRPP